MSNFMNFLDNLDEKIINETYTTDVEDEVVEDVVEKNTPSKKKSSRKKDSSVKLIEKRIRNKLDDIGLNDKAISDVVSYVLEDIQKVSGIKNTKHNKQQKPQSHIEENMSIVGRAESLLEGLPETPTYGVPLGNQSNISESSNESMSDIADHASSLLG